MIVIVSTYLPTYLPMMHQAEEIVPVGGAYGGRVRDLESKEALEALHTYIHTYIQTDRDEIGRNMCMYVGS